MDSERVPFAAHRLGKFAADFFARDRALRRLIKQIGAPPDRKHAAQIAACLGNIAGADGLALDAVGIEQAVAAPAFEHRGEFPG